VKEPIQLSSDSIKPNYSRTLPRTKPENVGISSAVLYRLVERLNSLDCLNSIILSRNGHVCLEGWWSPYSPEIPHMLFSLSKSFVSVAIGIAAEENLLHISDCIVEYFPECRQNIVDNKMKKVTIHHLLSMSSGHAVCAKSEMEKDPEQNYVRGFLASSLPFAPGERFAYNSAATYMLAALIKKVTGLNVREYLQPRLFSPLGIVPGIWESDPHGTNLGGWGLYLTTEDIAKFANLLLNNGMHNGRQLIPASYLTEATKKQSDNSMNESPDWKLGYGYQFWMSKYGYRADGASGQYAIVILEKSLTLAITSSVDNMQEILTIIWDTLIPELSDNPLPEDSPAHESLRHLMTSLALRPTISETSIAGKDCFWEFEANSAEIKTCALTFSEGLCALTFWGKNGMEQLRAGFGKFLQSTIRLTDELPHSTAACAAWKNETILEINTFCLDGTFRDTYVIDFTNSEHPLSRKSRCSTFRPLLPDLKVMCSQNLGQ